MSPQFAVHPRYVAPTAVALITAYSAERAAAQSAARPQEWTGEKKTRHPQQSGKVYGADPREEVEEGFIDGPGLREVGVVAEFPVVG